MERQMNTTATTMMTSSSPTSPTTFVQADTDTFRDLVQKLTGLAGDSEKLSAGLASSSTPSSKPSHRHHPIDHHATAPRRSPFKLQERRQQHSMRKLEIKLGLTSLRSPFSGPHQTHRANNSPVASPVTPLGPEPLFFPSPGTESALSPAVLEEERVISEKGFYLYPSPLNTPRGSEPPELLNLFPLSSAPSQSENLTNKDFWAGELM